MRTTSMPDLCAPYKGCASHETSALSAPRDARPQPRAIEHTRNAGEMLSTQHAPKAPFQTGSEGEGTVSINPPPARCTYPSGKVKDWPVHFDEDWRQMAALAFDLRLQRADHAVWSCLWERYRYTPFTLDVSDVEWISAALTLADWGKKATPNRVALSLKRLARCGFITSCPAAVFRAGIDRKATPKKLRDKVFARDGHACLHCGRKDFLEADHIIPRSKGGETILENLQTLCAGCNRLKGVGGA